MPSTSCCGNCSRLPQQLGGGARAPTLQPTNQTRELTPGAVHPALEQPGAAQLWPQSLQALQFCGE
jgi:hypothetical protein